MPDPSKPNPNPDNPDIGPVTPIPDSIETALGPIPTEVNAFVAQILKIAIAIAGGVALILIIIGAVQIITSSGNSDKVKAGQELITAAIAGLLFIILSLFLLQLIGVKIFQIPGLS